MFYMVMPPMQSHMLSMIGNSGFFFLHAPGDSQTPSKLVWGWLFENTKTTFRSSETVVVVVIAQKAHATNTETIMLWPGSDYTYCDSKTDPRDIAYNKSSSRGFLCHKMTHAS